MIRLTLALSLLAASPLPQTASAPVVPFAPVAPSAPVVRVRCGRAQLIEGLELRSLNPSSGTLSLSGSAYLECGPGSEIEVLWRGLASARVLGPAALEVDPALEIDHEGPEAPHLWLEHFQTVELEARRDVLVVRLPGEDVLAIGSGAVRLRSLPGGDVELLNRGGESLELRRAPRPATRARGGSQGASTLTVPPGSRARLGPWPR